MTKKETDNRLIAMRYEEVFGFRVSKPLTLYAIGYTLINIPLILLGGHAWCLFFVAWFFAYSAISQRSLEKMMIEHLGQEYFDHQLAQEKTQRLERKKRGKSLPPPPALEA